MEIMMKYLSQGRSFYEKAFSAFHALGFILKSERNLKVALPLLKEKIL